MQICLGVHLLQQMELKVGYSVKRRDASTRTTRFPTDVRGGEFNFCNHLCVANRKLFCSVTGLLKCYIIPGFWCCGCLRIFHTAFGFSLFRRDPKLLSRIFSALRAVDECCTSCCRGGAQAGACRQYNVTICIYVFVCIGVCR